MNNKTEFVLVEAIEQHLIRYVVEVPVGKSEWALDTVTSNDAREFSQTHIGETIISHRVVTETDIMENLKMKYQYGVKPSFDVVYRQHITPISGTLNETE